MPESKFINIGKSSQLFFSDCRARLSCSVILDFCGFKKPVSYAGVAVSSQFVYGFSDEEPCHTRQ